MLRCPTCLSLVFDRDAKRCPSCRSKIRTRSRPTVMVESNLADRPLPLVEQELQARIEAETAARFTQRRRAAKAARRIAKLPPSVLVGDMVLIPDDPQVAAPEQPASGTIIDLPAESVHDVKSMAERDYVAREPVVETERVAEPAPAARRRKPRRRVSKVARIEGVLADYSRDRPSRHVPVAEPVIVEPPLAETPVVETSVVETVAVADPVVETVVVEPVVVLEPEPVVVVEPEPVVVLEPEPVVVLEPEPVVVLEPEPVVVVEPEPVVAVVEPVVETVVVEPDVVPVPEVVIEPEVIEREVVVPEVVESEPEVVVPEPEVREPQGVEPEMMPAASWTKSASVWTDRVFNTAPRFGPSESVAWPPQWKPAGERIDLTEDSETESVDASSP